MVIEITLCFGMAEPYSLRWFLLHAKLAHLGQFLHGKSLLRDFAFGYFRDGDVELVEAEIGRLNPEAREDCESTFVELYRMGSRAGINSIIAASCSKHLYKECDSDLRQKLGAMESYLDGAFWIYLNRPQYWEVACNLASADALGVTAWEKHPKMPRREPRTDNTSLSALGGALGSYFHTMEGRGPRCDVSVCDRPERLHVFCFLEAQARALPEWQAEGMRRRPHKPVQPLTYMYSRIDGVLDVHFKGKPSVIWDLMAIFALHVLGEKRIDPPPKSRGVYRLDCFKYRGAVRFHYGPQSEITSVSVRRLRLTPKLGAKRHITIEGSPTPGVEPVYDALENELTSLRLDDVDVTQVELQVKFRRTATRRQRTIDATVTVPNRCSLAYDDRELLVRKMLIDSGIELTDERL